MTKRLFDQTKRSSEELGLYDSNEAQTIHLLCIFVFEHESESKIWKKINDNKLLDHCNGNVIIWNFILTRTT